MQCYVIKPIHHENLNPVPYFSFPYIASINFKNGGSVSPNLGFVLVSSLSHDFLVTSKDTNLSKINPLNLVIRKENPDGVYPSDSRIKLFNYWAISMLLRYR